MPPSTICTPRPSRLPLGFVLRQSLGVQLPQRAHFPIFPSSQQFIIKIICAMNNFPADIFPLKLVNKILFRWTAWSNPSFTLQSTEDFKKISFARCSSALVVKLIMWQKSPNWQLDRPHHLQYWYQHWQIYPANVYSKCYLFSRFCITFMCYFSRSRHFWSLMIVT